ncbi:MAG: ECF transporter S component [Prevotella sp.]|nr:ECF transporter S component [Prevotella sp.]
MVTNAKLYTLNYDEVRTWMWAAVFVACNMILPQVFHLIPQGGIIFAPLSFVILAGAYKLGWKTGLVAAVASPIVNNLVFGMPEWGVLPVMMVKLVVLAMVAGLTAQYFKRATLLILLGVVIVSELLGGIGELILTGGVSATVADFTIGWPGLLLQLLGTYLIAKIDY